MQNCMGRHCSRLVSCDTHFQLKLGALAAYLLRQGLLQVTLRPHKQRHRAIDLLNYSSPNIEAETQERIFSYILTFSTDWRQIWKACAAQATAHGTPSAGGKATLSETRMREMSPAYQRRCNFRGGTAKKTTPPLPQLERPLHTVLWQSRAACPGTRSTSGFQALKWPAPALTRC